MNRKERLRWDPGFIDKSKADQTWYKTQLPEFITQISIRKNLRSYLAPVLGGRVKLTKRQARKILDAISQNYTLELCDFFNIEAGIGRFTLEEFVVWFDKVIHTRGASYMIRKCVDHMVHHRKVQFSEVSVINWVEQAFLQSAFKDAGELLLVTKYHLSPLLSNHELWRNTLDAARQKGDHGIARLFPILLMRLRPKRGRLSKNRAKGVAMVIHEAYVSRKDEDGNCFESKFLISMLTEYFSAKATARVMDAYYEMLEITYTAKAKEVESALTEVRTLRKQVKK